MFASVVKGYPSETRLVQTIILTPCKEKTGTDNSIAEWLLFQASVTLTTLGLHLSAICPFET
jgi:hypothetical protein